MQISRSLRIESATSKMKGVQSKAAGDETSNIENANFAIAQK
jgi:hypothetical protein